MTTGTQTDGVRVKALRWVQKPTYREGHIVFHAASVIGEYQAWQIDGYGAWSNDRLLGCYRIGDNVEAAKAAAQADYETRIRSALLPAPATADAGVGVERVLRRVRSSLQTELERGVITDMLWMNDVMSETIFDALEAALRVPAPTGEGVVEAELGREVWDWLVKRELVDPQDDEWRGFTEVIEEHEDEISASARREAESALARAGDGWRDIASAPKDAKEFLVCLPRQGNIRLIVRWDRIWDRWLSKGDAISLFPGDLWTPLPTPPFVKED